MTTKHDNKTKIDVAFNEIKTPNKTIMPAQIFTWAGMPEGMYVEKTAAGIIVLLGVLISLNAIAIYLRKKFEVKW
jgi:phosphate transport system permease protein